MQVVPSGWLPLRHSSPMHGAAGDTAAAARVDSLRGVRVTVRASNGLNGSQERTRDLSRFVRFPKDTQMPACVCVCVRVRA